MRGRLLGSNLAAIVASRGWPLHSIAQRVGILPTAVSKILSGVRRNLTADVAGILALCEVTGPDRDQALRLAEDLDTLDTGKENWFQLEDPQRAPHWDVQAFVEQSATELTVYHPLGLPELTHTPLTATETAATAPTTTARRPQTTTARSMTARSTTVEDRGSRLTQRQSALRRDHYQRYRFVVHAESLDDAPAEQLQHLIRLTAHPTVSLRIIVATHDRETPTSPFTLALCPPFAPVVCLPLLGAVAVLEEPDTVDAYHQTMRRLLDISLDQAESRAWLNKAHLLWSPPRDPSVRSGGVCDSG